MIYPPNIMNGIYTELSKFSENKPNQQKNKKTQKINKTYEWLFCQIGTWKYIKNNYPSEKCNSKAPYIWSYALWIVKLKAIQNAGENIKY